MRAGRTSEISWSWSFSVGFTWERFATGTCNGSRNGYWLGRAENPDAQETSVSTQETTSTTGGGPGGTNILELTSEIAAGYMAHNSLPANDVPGFIGSIFTTLTGLQSGGGT